MPLASIRCRPHPQCIDLCALRFMAPGPSLSGQLLRIYRELVMKSVPPSRRCNNPNGHLGGSTRCPTTSSEPVSPLDAYVGYRNSAKASNHIASLWFLRPLTVLRASEVLKPRGHTDALQASCEYAFVLKDYGGDIESRSTFGRTRGCLMSGLPAHQVSESWTWTNVIGRSFQILIVDYGQQGIVTLEQDGHISHFGDVQVDSWQLIGEGLVLRTAGKATMFFCERLPLDGSGISLRGTSLPIGHSTTYLLIEQQFGGTIIDELERELFSGRRPYSAADDLDVDEHYPHTNITPEIIGFVLDLVRPKFWLEIGSMLGGSAIRTAEEIKCRGLETVVVCIDPFSGDVHMWELDRARRLAGLWSFLKTEHGRPRIYERFLANVRAAKHDDIILPVPVSSIVGLKLLRRLHALRRLSRLPDVIYLDSAHEPDETLLELQQCWSSLKTGGVLIGDDWTWPSVRRDVLRFACSVDVNAVLTRIVKEQHPAFDELEGILITQNHWLMFR